MDGGVFWRGADNNMWVKDGAGTRNAGQWDDKRASSMPLMMGYTQSVIV